MKGNQELYQALVNELKALENPPEGSFTVKQLCSDTGRSQGWAGKKIKEWIECGKIEFIGKYKNGTTRHSKHYVVKEQ